MNPKKYVFHKLADTADALAWQANNLCVVEVSGKKMTIARHNGQVFACAYKCPHAGGILADGHVNAAGQLACPLHRYRFDLKNGRNSSGEGYFLPVFPVEMREDGIYIGLEDKGFWSSF